MTTPVFLHMLGGDAREWDSLRTLLPDQGVAIDLPGHGLARDGDVPPPRVITLEDAARHILSRSGEDAIALIGTSAGGAVAARIATLMPARVVSLTLISTALTRASTIEAMAALEAEALGRDYDAGEMPLPRDKAATRAAFAIDDPLIHAEIEASRRHAGRWIKPLWRGVAQADLIELLARTTIPTRLIYGEHDPYRRYVSDAAPRIGAHEIAIVPGAGSFPHRTHPQDVAKLLAI